MFRQIVQDLFSHVQLLQINPILIEKPQDRSMGDFALPCFSFAKELKKSPNVIAQEIVEELNTYLSDLDLNKNVSDCIARAEAVGPYVNVTLDGSWVASEVLSVGTSCESGKSKERLIIESPGPNTNKPLHLGHVRNMLLGNALGHIAEYAGYDVHKVDIVNDRGVHICKSMLAYRELGNNAQPDKKSDHYVGDWYVAYNTGIKANHPEWETEIQNMLVQREAGDPEVRALWLKMRDRALEGMNETYARYGCYIDKPYYESDHYLKGKQIVQDGLDAGVFKTNDKGNIIFEDTELGEKVLLRSDGTSIYITQDIALGKIRYADWQMDRMVYVVGNEQADHFAFLFKIFETLGYEFGSKCYHLSYGMISLPDGKMKSREGNVVDADALIEEMHTASYEMLANRYPDDDTTALHAKAEHIAMAAIKFFVLKYDSKKDFVFDREESLSFDGESGPYIQYTYARCGSVLEKANGCTPSSEKHLVNYTRLALDSERLLCLRLAEFGEVVVKAADEYKPSLVARYILELAREFNKYYQTTKILVEDDETLTHARLTLVESVQQVLKTGLGLLGIQTIEKM